MPSGLRERDLFFLSLKMYISLPTMSDDSPTLLIKRSVDSAAGVVILWRPACLHLCLTTFLMKVKYLCSDGKISGMPLGDWIWLLEDFSFLGASSSLT